MTDLFTFAYECPYCGQRLYNLTAFTRHVNQRHESESAFFRLSLLESGGTPGQPLKGRGVVLLTTE